MNSQHRIEELPDRNIIRLVTETARANGLVFSSCLDVGCGLNPLIHWFQTSGLATANASYSAIEAHDEVIKKLQQRGIDAMKPDAVPEGFCADLVIAQEVLEHVRPGELEGFVANLRNRAKSMVAVTCPNFEMYDPQLHASKEPELRFVPDHLKHFDAASEHPFMHKVATTPELVERLLGPVFTNGGWNLRVFRAWPWMLVDVPARRVFQVYFKVFALAWKSGEPNGSDTRTG